MISKEDRLMLEFALRWASYGGPPSDLVFIEFGVTRDVFWHRLSKATAEGVRNVRALSNEDRALILKARAYEVGERPAAFLT